MSYRNNIQIQLGMLSLLVGLDGAIEAEESLSTVCRGTDAAPHEITPIKRSPVCPACSNDDYSSFLKARKEGKSTYHVVTAEEIDAVKVAAVGGTKDIITLSAHPATDVATQTLPGDSIYYLSPSKDGHLPVYGMLVDLVRRHPEYAFLGLWTPVSRTNLFQLSVYGDTLVLQGRARTEAIKVRQQPAVPLESNQQAMADQLLTMMATPFDPATYVDSYAANLDALLTSKAGEEGALVLKSKSAAKASAAPVVDLTAMLAGALSAANPGAAA